MPLNVKIFVHFPINKIDCELAMVVSFVLSVGAIHMHPAFASVSVFMPFLLLMGAIVSILFALGTSQSLRVLAVSKDKMKYNRTPLPNAGATGCAAFR